MDIPKNKAIDIREIAKMYKEQYNEELPNIVDRYGYIIHEAPATKKAPERSTAELIAEAQKIIDRKEPIAEPNTNTKKVGTVKELSQLLHRYVSEAPK